MPDRIFSWDSPISLHLECDLSENQFLLLPELKKLKEFSISVHDLPKNISSIYSMYQLESISLNCWVHDFYGDEFSKLLKLSHLKKLFIFSETFQFGEKFKYFNVAALLTSLPELQELFIPIAVFDKNSIEIIQNWLDFMENKDRARDALDLEGKGEIEQFMVYLKFR